MSRLGRSWRPWVRAVIGIAVSAAFIGITLSRVELTLVAEAWASVGYALLAVAFAISIVEVGVRAIRWSILLRPFVLVSFGNTLAFLSIGHLANAILPARLGDLARALVTGSRTRSSRASILGTIAVERVADAGLLGLAAVVGVLVGYGQLAPAVGVLALAGVAAAGAMAIAARVLGRNAVAATRVGGLLLHFGRRFVAGGAALRNPIHLARIGLLTVMSFTLAVTIMFTVTSAVGLALPIWQAAVVMAAVTLSTAIPAGPASIGTYEFAGVVVLSGMGYPAEASLLAVGLVHVIVTLPPALTGLVSMWLLGIRTVSLGPTASRSSPAERAT